MAKTRKRTFRRFAYLGVALLIAYGAVRWARPAQSSPGNASVAESQAFTTVAKHDIEQFVRASGRVSPERQTEVKSEVSALVASLKVQPGDIVKKGQMLAELDRRELESQIKEASLQIESSRLQIEKVNQNLKRNEQLHTAHLYTDKDLQDSRIDAALADNSYQLQQARLETLRQQLTKTTVLAPIDGVVLNVDALEGAVIIGANSTSSGTPLMKIANLDRLLVKTEINEVDVAKLRAKMPVQLSFDSVPGLKVDGVMQFVSPSATEKERGSNDREPRGFPIVVSFPMQDPRIRPGMTANLKVSVAKAKDAIGLELSAVFLEEKINVIYVDNKRGGIERRTVELGINDNHSVEITKGLAVGERVSLTRPVAYIPKSTNSGSAYMDDD